MGCCKKRSKLRKLQQNRKERLRQVAERRRLINERRKSKKRVSNV